MKIMNKDKISRKWKDQKQNKKDFKILQVIIIQCHNLCARIIYLTKLRKYLPIKCIKDKKTKKE